MVTRRCPGVVKLMMGFHHGNLKMTEFMMELHYESPEGGDASIETSLYELPHLYEMLSSQFHKKD